MSRDAGWRGPQQTLTGLVGLVVSALAGYAALYLAVGRTFAPGTPLWALCVLWVTSHVAGYISQKCYLPPLLGMLLTGLLLRNLGALSTEGIPVELSAQVCWACISVMLLRAGLLVKLRAFRARKLAMLRLGVLPCLTTGSTYAGVMGVLIKMPPLLAIMCGLLLVPACSLSIVTDLQSLQLSEAAHPSMTPGMPEVLTAASATSIAICTLLASLFSQLAFPHGPRALIWLHLPLSLALGCAAGAAAATICSLRLFWRTPWQRTAVALLVAQTLAFLGFRYEYFGAAVLALLAMGCTLSSMWDSGHPRLLTLPELPRARLADEVGERLDIVWELVAQPLLFGVAGAAVSFLALPHMAAMKCLAAALIGITVKAVVTFCGLIGAKLPFKEEVLVTIYAMPQASTALVTCFLPLYVAYQFVGTASDSFADYKRWADAAVTTAVFGALLATPLSSLAMHFLAPRLQEALRRSAPVSHPSGLDGALDREASGQLPAAASKAAAGRRHSDNPFADRVPFGADVTLPAGNAAPPLLQHRPATTNSGNKIRRSDEESQLLQDSADAIVAHDSIYISAVSGPSDGSAQRSSRQGGSLHDPTDESEEAHLLHPWVAEAAAEPEVVETGGAEDARRGTGNPFAAFLGNPFGLGRTLSRHFGSFTAGSWPSPTAFSALKETEVEMVQDQPSANNPMYAPQFQDYVVDRTDASFHANPTYGPIPALATSAAERALNEGITGDGDAERGLLGRPSDLRFGALRRMSAALAAALAGNAAQRSSTAVGSLETIPDPPLGAESTQTATQSHLSSSSLHTVSPGLPSNLAPDGLTDRERGRVTTEQSEEEISGSEGRKYAGSAGTFAALAGGWGASYPTYGEGHGRSGSADIEINIGESSASEYGTDSMRDSSDLTFAVTDGLDLEELPRTVSQLPRTMSRLPRSVNQLPRKTSQLPAHRQWHAGNDQPALSVTHSFPQSIPETSNAVEEADLAINSPAAFTADDSKDAHGRRGSLLTWSIGSSTAPLTGTSTSLDLRTDKGRSSDYALFAQLSAAMSASEGSASRPAPFVLRYEVSAMGTGTKQEVHKDAAVGDAEPDSFTFAQHSPRVSVTSNSSPIPFIAPAATLLRQGSSTVHVLGILGSPDQPAKQPSHAKEYLSVDINPDEPMQPDGHESGMLMFPVRDWLDKSEAAWQLHEGQHVRTAQGSVQQQQAGAQDTADEAQSQNTSHFKRSLHVRVAASSGTLGSMVKDKSDVFLEQGESNWERALNSTEQCPDGDHLSTMISSDARSNSPNQIQDKIGLQHGSGSGETAPADLESFDSIPLTPKVDDAQTASSTTATVEADSDVDNAEANSSLQVRVHGDVPAEGRKPLADNSQPEFLHATEDFSGPAEWLGNSQHLMVDTNSDMLDTSADTSNLVTEIRKSPRPYSASRLRESLPSLKVLKEAGSTGVGRITSIPKSLGRLMRNSGSGGEHINSGLEPILADEEQQETSAPGPALLLAGGVAKTGSYLGDANIGTYRSLLRPLSARFGSSSQDGSHAAGPTAKRASGEVSNLAQISLDRGEEERQPQLAHLDEAHVPHSGLVKVSPDESWLRKAHSITSPRPTDLDDLPATPLPTFAGAWVQLTEEMLTEDPDASTVVSTHFSSAKRYSDVDAKSTALLHAQASIKAYRRTDSSRGTWSREGSVVVYSNVTGSGGADRQEGLDDMEDVYDSFLKGPLSHVDDVDEQTDGLSKGDVMVGPTDSGRDRMQVLPLEDISLLEGAVGPKKKGYFLRKLRH